jgi:hypothetical protein
VFRCLFELKFTIPRIPISIAIVSIKEGTFKTGYNKAIEIPISKPISAQRDKQNISHKISSPGLLQHLIKRD